MRNQIFFIILFVLTGCQVQKQNHKIGWKLIYKNDTQGSSLHGSKEELIQLVRQGYPIRIGFGGQRPNDHSKSIEHVADANFITITNQNEVFAQINPIISQQPDL